MAIDSEFLAPLFEGVEGGEERVSKIISEYNADVIGLKRKNEELLGSVKSTSEKQEALLKEKEALEAAAKELNEKLESGLPDKEKQYFQTEVEKWKTNAANTAVELNRQLSEREQKISALEADHHNYICHQEFEKLLNSDSSIIPELREPMTTLFFTTNQFEWFEVSGEKKLLNKDSSKPMKDVLTDFLNTPAGQYFRVSRNNGGGASGSKAPGSNVGNPWKKEEVNLTKQGQILRENPTLAATLKAAAGVPA
jgi:hypothetical protein